MQPLTDEEVRIKIAEIAQTFSPNAPIDNQDLFAGRLAQLVKVLNAVSQRGQHVVIYGERGVGKTSLANIISPGLQAEALVAGQNCNQQTTFRSLWKNALRSITLISERQEAGFASGGTRVIDSLDSKLGDNPTPEDIRYMLSSLPKSVLIFDEMDRVEDTTTKTLLADTIKTLSDHSVDTTLILVGVAESVDTLIAEHRSIERALVQIYMPRMSVTELNQIVDKGLARVSMTIDSDARVLIADLSHGLPHYAHLLALHAAQAAVIDRSRNISRMHVKEAMKQAVTDAQQSIINSYHAATNSPRANLFAQVLLSCALAPTDDLGYFSAADVRAPMKQITGKNYDIPAFAQHLKEFCEKERGPILKRTGYPRRYRFRFINPLMEPYVIMKGVADKLIADTDSFGAHVPQRELESVPR